MTSYQIVCLYSRVLLPLVLLAAFGRLARSQPGVCLLLGWSSLSRDRYYFMTPVQLVILNFSSIFGRLAPGFLANTVGVGNMMAISTGCCSVLIFAMIGLKSVVSVVIIGVLYGFFAGSCEFIFKGVDSDPHDVSLRVVVSLTAPLMAVLTDDMSELGWVYLSAAEFHPSLTLCDSARMGIAYSISGLSLP